VLIEYPGCPRCEVAAYRLDGGFLLYATDGPKAAEAVYLEASRILQRSLTMPYPLFPNPSFLRITPLDRIREWSSIKGIMLDP
jgi:hypothetical protein